MPNCWFRMNKHSGLIEPVHVVRHTDHNVWLKDDFTPRRFQRNTAWEAYYRDYEEAKAVASAVIEDRLRHAEKMISQANASKARIAEIDKIIADASKEEV